MRILQLTTHINIGGIGIYVVNLAKAMKSKGHAIFAASSGGELEKRLFENGIPHFRIDIGTKSELSPKVLKSFLAVKNIAERENIDLIHAHTRVAAVTAALVSRWTGIPYITTCHGFFKKRLGRIIFGCWGRKTIAISDAVKRHLIEDFKVPEAKVELIYTGVDTAYFLNELSEAEKAEARKEFGFQKDDFLIGTIGRLSPIKGQDALLKAANDIFDKMPSARILIIGDGPDEARLKAAADSLRVNDKVFFFKSVCDTKKALSVIDIFVMPSVKEGLGLSLIEAMACGKPCIASKAGGIENVIEDGKSGLLFDRNDPNDLAWKIIKLSNDKELMAFLGRNARERALLDFALDDMAAKVENLYKEIVNKEHRTKDMSIVMAGRSSIINRKKILIINVNWLGDVIFSTPFIRAVRELCPESYIACVVAPRCKEILYANSRINELIIFDEDGKEKGLIGKIRFIMNLRRERFDTAFILHRSFTRAFITFLAGIKERIGYDTKGRGIILTGPLKLPKEPMHKVEYFLKLAWAAGADISKKNYEFFLTDSDRIEASEVIKSFGVNADEPYVALNPGGNWDPKRWPIEHFALLGDRLAEKYRVKILISGGKKDEELAVEISNKMRHKAVSLCGKTTVRGMAAIFEKSKLVISGDSGPMHISVSVGASTIAIFGPTDPAITGPYGGSNYTVIQKNIGCAVPCYDMNCRENRCMAAVLPDDVMDVIEKKGYLK